MRLSLIICIFLIFIQIKQTLTRPCCVSPSLCVDWDDSAVCERAGATFASLSNASELSGGTSSTQMYSNVDCPCAAHQRLGLLGGNGNVCGRNANGLPPDQVYDYWNAPSVINDACGDGRRPHEAMLGELSAVAVWYKDALASPSQRSHGQLDAVEVEGACDAEIRSSTLVDDTGASELVLLFGQKRAASRVRALHLQGANGPYLRTLLEATSAWPASAKLTPGDYAYLNDAVIGVAVDQKRQVAYVTTSGVHNNGVRRIDLRNGQVQWWAGTGEKASMLPFVPNMPQLEIPMDVEYVCVDEDSGDVFVTHRSDGLLVRLDGVHANVLAGGGTSVTLSDVEAFSARLYSPGGVAYSSRRRQLFFAESYVSRVRALDLESGRIHLVAGDRRSTFLGDGSSSNSLNYPMALTLDRHDHLYIADSINDAVRKVDLDRMVMGTVAGKGIADHNHITEFGYTLASATDDVRGVAVDALDNLYIAAENTRRLFVLPQCVGACCLPSGTCTEAFGAETCSTPFSYTRGGLGGRFYGVGVTCEQINNCLPTEAPTPAPTTEHPTPAPTPRPSSVPTRAPSPAPTPVPEGLREGDWEQLLAITIKFAEHMMEYGTDRYGEKHSPLLSSILHRNNGHAQLVDRIVMHGDPNPGWPPRFANLPNIFIGGDYAHKVEARGANPSDDPGLYRVLYDLSADTGDPRYRAAADASLRFFLMNAQLEVSGLLTWGEHSGWDFRTETYETRQLGSLHEFQEYWERWDELDDIFSVTNHHDLLHELVALDGVIGTRSMHASHVYEQLGTPVNASSPPDTALSFEAPTSCEVNNRVFRTPWTTMQRYQNGIFWAHFGWLDGRLYGGRHGPYLQPYHNSDAYGMFPRHMGYIIELWSHVIRTTAPDTPAMPNCTGFYDEQIMQVNDVDASAAGGLDFERFQAELWQAYTEDRAGVVDFDRLVGVRQPYVYGARGRHAVIIDFKRPMTLWNYSGRRMISGNRNFLYSYTGTYESGVEAGFEAEFYVPIEALRPAVKLHHAAELPDALRAPAPVIQVGITAISRHNVFQTVTMAATLDNGTDIVLTGTVAAGVAVHDTFFGIEAPPGRYIRRVRLWSSAYTGLDDLGFIMERSEEQRAPDAVDEDGCAYETVTHAGYDVSPRVYGTLRQWRSPVTLREQIRDRIEWLMSTLNYLFEVTWAQVDANAPDDEAYRRYGEWLPFSINTFPATEQNTELTYLLHHSYHEIVDIFPQTAHDMLVLADRVDNHTIWWLDDWLQNSASLEPPRCVCTEEEVIDEMMNRTLSGGGGVDATAGGTVDMDEEDRNSGAIGGLAHECARCREMAATAGTMTTPFNCSNNIVDLPRFVRHARQLVRTNLTAGANYPDPYDLAVFLNATETNALCFLVHQVPALRIVNPRSNPNLDPPLNNHGQIPANDASVLSLLTMAAEFSALGIFTRAPGSTCAYLERALYLAGVAELRYILPNSFDPVWSPLPRGINTQKLLLLNGTAYTRAFYHSYLGSDDLIQAFYELHKVIVEHRDCFPTEAPTVAPSTAPSTSPSAEPTMSPTTGPTYAPSLSPSMAPTLTPSLAPSEPPSVAPTEMPTAEPPLTTTVSDDGRSETSTQTDSDVAMTTSSANAAESSGAIIDDRDGDSLGGGAIAALVVCGLLCLICIVFGAIFFVNRRRKQPQANGAAVQDEGGVEHASSVKKREAHTMSSRRRGGRTVSNNGRRVDSNGVGAKRKNGKKLTNGEKKGGAVRHGHVSPRSAQSPR